jgi:hypothetical protein
MAKKLKIALIVLFSVVAAFVLIYIILMPKRPAFVPKNVEGVFPGGEAAYIKTSGLVDVWESLKNTHYYRSGGYKPLSKIPPIFDLRLLGEKEEIYKRGFNPDILMNLFGYESALGVYINDGIGGAYEEKRPSYLFVSIVHPNFLLAERLFAFFGEGEHIRETTYMGLPMVEIDTDETGKIQYVLDGDFLIISNDPDILDRAVTRYLEGEQRPKDNTLLLLGKEVKGNTIISGLVYPEKFGGKINLPFPFGGKIKQYIPEELISFVVDYEKDERLLSLKARGGIRPFPIDTGKSKRPVDTLKGDELALIYYKDIPLITPLFGDLIVEDKDVDPISEVIDNDSFVGLFRYQKKSEGPGFFVFGASNSAFNDDIKKTLSVDGYDIVEGIEGENTIYTAERDCVEEFAWAYLFKGNINFLILGRNFESVANALNDIPETAAHYMKDAKQGLYLEASPKKVWDEVSMYPEYFDRLVSNLILPNTLPEDVFWDLQLIEGLCPVQSMSASAEIDRDEASLIINMEIEDKIP